jgi:hypothetical protein
MGQDQGTEGCRDHHAHETQVVGRGTRTHTCCTESPLGEVEETAEPISIVVGQLSGLRVFRLGFISLRKLGGAKKGANIIANPTEATSCGQLLAGSADHLQASNANIPVLLFVRSLLDLAFFLFSLLFSLRLLTRRTRYAHFVTEVCVELNAATL